MNFTHTFKFTVLVMLVLLLGGLFLLPAQSRKQMDAAEIQLALKKLQVLGGALYIAAHPDDENTALLAYLARERLVRTGYVSLTRGSGGQNLLGTEKGDLLGVIRSEELLAARRIDGAEQFFTRARDFGYSKTPAETLQKWDSTAVLGDLVRIIRRFRPDVLITQFTPELGGHGHHRASAILAAEAFRLAGNPTVFPGQLSELQPWQPKRLLWNVWNWAARTGRADTSGLPWLNLGAYNPLLGVSYGEIAASSRSMHKSQGFGMAPRRGTARQYFLTNAGEPAEGDIFSGVNTSWSRIPGGETITGALQAVLEQFQPEHPAASLPALLRIDDLLDKLPADPWVARKRRELHEVIGQCAGLWISARTELSSVAPGDSLRLTLAALNRSEFPIRLEQILLPAGGGKLEPDVFLKENEPWEKEIAFRLPGDTPFTQPLWLGNGTEPPTASFIMDAAGRRLSFAAPVLRRWTDPVSGERSRPLQVLPALILQAEQPVYLFPDGEPRPVTILLHANGDHLSGRVRLSAGEGWRIEPVVQSFTLNQAGDETLIEFTISPTSGAQRTELSLLAEAGGRTYRQGQTLIDYPHIPVQVVLTPARPTLLRLDLQRRKQRLGYIMGSGDEIPGFLEQLGYRVELLSDGDLSGDLSGYQTIIAGVRAYNTRDALRQAQAHLLEYVKDGGTLLLQYNTTRGLVTDPLGPYPFELSHQRITVEEAPLEIRLPNHPLLNTPNKINPADFTGWVQERGLYFAGEWDSTYQAPLSGSDPGEDPLQGMLLSAEYGKGTFIYTGLSFFRQLPAGVPGAFRLLVNLIEAGGEDAH